MFSRIAALLTVAALLAPATASAAPNPLTCEGYPEKRQFVEAQTWWTVATPQTGTPHGHLHVGACIPEREKLSAPRDLDVRLILHDNGPTKVYSSGSYPPYVSLVHKGAGYETTVEKDYFTGWSCAVGTCTKWTKMTLDPAKFQESGLQEVRFRFFLHVKDPDGTKRMSASLNWQLYVDNGKTRRDVTRDPFVRGKGWYTGSNYCEAGLRSVPLPDYPVADPWAPVVRLLDHGTSDVDPKHHTVTLDPDFHNGVPGTVIRSADGTYEGPVSVPAGPGPHRLALKNECPDSRGTNVGVLVVPFASNG